jgi:tetratricopeptide (TPR) repeat protein
VLLAMNLWFVGDLDVAERELAALSPLHSQMGALATLPHFCHAGILGERGAPDEAIRVASELVAAGQARRHPVEQGRGRWALGVALLRAGDLDAAERELLSALDLLAPVMLDQPGVMAALAAVRLAAGRTAEALRDAERALQLYEGLRGASFFRASFIRLVHAECLDAAGRRDEARAAIANARGRLLAIAETIEAPPVRQTFLENVPENARTLALARQWEADR